MRLVELLAIPVGLFVVKQFTDRIQDEPKTKDVVSARKVTARARPATPIIPTFTKSELEEQQAFIARQSKQTREQLLSRFGL